ncbi:hypothetical protein [Streptomyces sp. MZ04]|uniref:hypothetical protein n=1 Tax=Streptomyces sp. MZ04 TaxID=2559236 RepID=UPI00107E6492|nr:hypothetical protein [Streptomyces sp. MZ04]TGB16063.1 hypothetical protein E2651_01060 [Streptomyces sp. MZ04]
MTEPSVEPHPKVQIVQVDTAGTDLPLTEIRRYPQATVTEVDPPHAARLTGTGADDLPLRAGDLLQGINPAA